MSLNFESYKLNNNEITNDTKLTKIALIHSIPHVTKCEDISQLCNEIKSLKRKMFTQTDAYILFGIWLMVLLGIGYFVNERLTMIFQLLRMAMEMMFFCVLRSIPPLLFLRKP